MDVHQTTVPRVLVPFVALLIWVAGSCCENQQVRAAQQDEEVEWYTPNPNDFRREYNRDKVNQRVQSWNQYWGWVTSFYNGNTFSVGWSRQARSDVSIVKSAKKQAELISLLNEVGKQISMEWAKDNGVRKISTSDLNRWNGVIHKGRTTEKGSGEQLKAAILQVRAEVAKKLGIRVRKTADSPSRG